MGELVEDAEVKAEETAEETAVTEEPDKAEKSDSDIAAFVQECYKEAKGELSEWRLEATEAFHFTSGHQWATDDISKMDDEFRPYVTFNRVEPIVDAIVGSEINNRQEIRFIPRNAPEDAMVNEQYTRIGEYIRDNCDAEDNETDAFRDTVICGLGWTDTNVDYDDNEDGDIKIEHVDPLEMLYDPSAKKRNLSDTRYRMRVRKIGKSSLEDMFPDKADELTAESDDVSEEFSDETGEPHDSTKAFEYKYDQKTGYSSKEQKFLVIQMQWFEMEPYYRVGAQGGIQELSVEKFDRARDIIESNGIPYVKQKRKVFKQAFVTGDVVLKYGDAPCKKGFSFIPITGKWDRKTKSFYGIVRSMKDPAMWSNKFFSQQLHLINTNAKGGVLIEENAVDDIRKFERDWAATDSVLVFKDGALSGGKMHPKPITPLNAGVHELMAFSINSIPSVTGVNMEMLGMADRQQAGVLEDQRKRSALTILAGLFNSLRRYRKESGRIMLYFMNEYISDGRLIRILGPEGNQYVQLMRQDETVKYDVIVDESPSSPNAKERVFTVFAQLMPSLLKAGVPIIPEILDFTPLPQSIAQKWKEALSQQRQPNPMAAKQQEAEIAKTQSEAEKNKAAAMVDQVSIGLDVAAQKLEEAKAINAAVNNQMNIGG